MQRNAHVDLLRRVDALEVDVQHLLLPRMHLELTQQHAFLAAIDAHVEDGRVERLELQMPEERVVVELDRRRRIVRAIDDAGNTAASAQAAARTGALLGAGKCGYFDFHLNSSDS